ncbi:MAG: hypothetical protein PHH00_03805 [Candidatus Nanoarchaeia archaeon]|nr:hypothetical protein [Candidatus Nanoarchaeia archaeon]
MERKVSDITILDEFVESFCKVMDKHCKYIVCSGFVAIAHGRTRGTEDVDMIFERVDNIKFKKLHEDLLKAGFICMQSANPDVLYSAYLSQGMSIRYVWKSDGFAPPEMEIKFPKDKLDEEQLKERTKLPLTGLDIYFSSVESNIAFKEEYLGAEKDLEDAKHLRIIYKGKIDEGKINKIKSAIKIRKRKQ